MRDRINLRNEAPERYGPLPPPPVIRQVNLTAVELSKAREYWIKHHQQQFFGEELNAVIPGQLPPKSKLAGLNPIIDNKGILRVGGRIKNAMHLSNDERQPIVLMGNQAYSDRLIHYTHQQTQHGGVQLVLQTTRQLYWIIGQRRAVKRIVDKCLPCYRHKRQLTQQLMGDLPHDRVTPGHPFEATGLDYCGPVHLKLTNTKKAITVKAYIAVFVCMATRAVHLELVTDLTSEAFLRAFRRFIGRRGLIRRLWSDNATTFVGAQRLLQPVAGQIRRASMAPEARQWAIEWHFITPRAPHEGGLWEAAVKATKCHLIRILQDRHMVYEEFETVLIDIEACLNSRPIQPLTNDPHDLNALTPGHFLIGRAPIQLPAVDLLQAPEGRLTRFNLLRRLQQDFWKRWSTDYMSALFSRATWKYPERQFAVGDMVLVKDYTTPPASWPLGRVTEVYPSDDGEVRRVLVRFKRTELRRSVQQLIYLPMAHQDIQIPVPEQRD